MKLSSLALVFVVLLAAICAVPVCAADAPVAIVDLDASQLAEGPLLKWQSNGPILVSFDVVPVGGAEVEQVSGRNAVVFDGKSNRFVSTFSVPASMTGASAYSVAAWVLNSTVETEEAVVCWAPRSVGDAKSGQLNYGSSRDFGAVTHWGKSDMGFDGGVPEAGKWHLIVATYGGSSDPLEKVYVDGKLNATEKKSLDVVSGSPIYLGSAGSEKFFSGAVASVRMYDYALSEQEIASIAGAGGKATKAALVDIDARTLTPGDLSEWKNQGTLGGSFGLIKYPPVVAELGGRKAVSFSKFGWLQSGVSLAEGPVTLEMWARVEQDGAQAGTPNAALSMGDIAGNEALRIGLSREMKGGALECGRTSIGFKNPPKLKAWHQIAYVYSDGTLRIYVDGELDSEQPCALDITESAPINLGAAWQPGKSVPYAGFDGAISRLCVYPAALTQQQIRTHNGMLNAFNPNLADGAVLGSLDATLTWEAGNPAAKSFDVYFGDSLEAVKDADKASVAVYKGSIPAANPKLGPLKLAIGHPYYWRVDQIGSDGKVTKGDVWQFSADPGKATNPSPRNQVSAVPVNTSTLAWTPGKFATQQTIYIATQEDWEKNSGRWTSAVLDATTHSYKLPFKLEPGTRYCWRVDNKNGSNPATTGDVWCFRTQDKLSDADITFYAISDLHYTGPDNSPANQDLINIMNAFPGTPYPESVGGNVATPRGIVVTGDVCNAGKQREWESFVADYGVNGDASIVYPMYELWGNHDGKTDGVVAQGIKARNPSRPSLTMISKNGFHYSWDWGKVHFTCVNIYPAQVSQIVIPNDPIYSLDFLREDLKKNVGKSGRPVAISMHYGLDGGGAGWWTEEEHKAFQDVIKDYNVIVVLFGHTHGGGNYKWNGVDMVNVGASLTGSKARQFVVFHITDKELVVARRYPDKWGEILRKPITGMSGK